MKIHSILLIFAYLLFFSTYSYAVKFVNNQYVPADYIVMADEITADVASKLTKRHNMKLIGVVGGLADCVNELGLEFQIRGPLTKDQLRGIVINGVEEFLTQINAHTRLRPFLKTYPFTADRIDITLYVIDNNGREMYDPEIAVATSL